jgi:hypothetical protein
MIGWYDEPLLSEELDEVVIRYPSSLDINKISESNFAARDFFLAQDRVRKLTKSPRGFSTSIGAENRIYQVLHYPCHGFPQQLLPLGLHHGDLCRTSGNLQSYFYFEEALAGYFGLS